MSTRRKTAPKAPPAPPREPPPPALPCPPEWQARDDWHDMQHSSSNLRQIVSGIADGTFHLPVFQRPFVWTEAQVVRLFHSILDGYFIGPLIVWERDARKVPAVSRIGDMEFPVKSQWDKAVVVDGQQRLTALALLFLSGRFAYDFGKRAVVIDQPEGRDVLGLAWMLNVSKTGESLRAYHHIVAWIADSGTEDAEWKYLWLERTLTRYYVSTVRFSRYWTLANVVESYRRLATEGVPMAPEHLAEGLARLAAEVTP